VALGLPPQTPCPLTPARHRAIEIAVIDDGAQVSRKTYFRHWRQHRQMTLEIAAALAGMTAGNLSALERGAQGYTQRTLEALATAYDTDPASLLSVDPTEPEADATWSSIWDRANPDERRMLVAIAETILRRR
jgi:transcriptional regulator with XRE-family HTH domain